MPIRLAKLDTTKQAPYIPVMAKRPERQAVFWEEIAQRIRSVIEDSELSVAELARRSGVTRAAVAQWADTGKISAAQVAFFAAAAGVSAEWLLTGKGGYSPEERAWLEQIKSLSDEDRRRIQALTDGLALTSGIESDQDQDPAKKSA